MPEKVIKEKVLVYVVRNGRLLVFRHTDYSWLGAAVGTVGLRVAGSDGGPVVGARSAAAGHRPVRPEQASHANSK